MGPRLPCIRMRAAELRNSVTCKLVAPCPAPPAQTRQRRAHTRNPKLWNPTTLPKTPNTKHPKNSSVTDGCCSDTRPALAGGSCARATPLQPGPACAGDLAHKKGRVVKPDLCCCLHAAGFRPGSWHHAFMSGLQGRTNLKPQDAQPSMLSCSTKPNPTPTAKPGRTNHHDSCKSVETPRNVA